jgi:release factor glutamine methyltransferase
MSKSAGLHDRNNSKNDKEDMISVGSWESFNGAAMELARSQPTADLPCLDPAFANRNFQYVYEPSDDTYLLIDAIQYDIMQLMKQQQQQQQTAVPICVEIGCGSGVASVVFRSSFLKTQPQPQLHAEESFQGALSSPKSLLNIVTDINPRALQVTRQTFRTAFPNGCSKVEAIQCDLLCPLLNRLEHAVSFLIFNPPYVPTPDDEVVVAAVRVNIAREYEEEEMIRAAWAGGTNGRQIMDRAVPQMAHVLARPHGIAYWVTVDENRPLDLAQRFAKLGLCMRPLFRRRAKNEFLTIQKITWKETVQPN